MTGSPGRPATRRVLVTAGVVVAVLAAVASLLASHDPDGLTKVSEDQGFAHTGSGGGGLLSYGPVAGVVGVVVVLVLVAALTRLARRRGGSHDPQRTDD